MSIKRFDIEIPWLPLPIQGHASDLSERQNSTLGYFAQGRADMASGPMRVSAASIGKDRRWLDISG
jgi:hypothetical protein